MLTLLSPAKTLDFETKPKTEKASKPVFSANANKLVKKMQEKSPKDISRLMGISENLANLNADRFRNFSVRGGSQKQRRQAILAFKGDVYQGLNAQSFTERDFTFAQKHLRILSGLYGLLKPLDLIQPHRLEMGTRLKTEKGESLYDFWGDNIPDSIFRELCSHKNQTIINLASLEYFKAIAQIESRTMVITPIFKDYSKGTYKIISFFAKKARGTMASFIIKNRITSPDGIKKFTEDGYQFNDSMSCKHEWIFTRKTS